MHSGQVQISFTPNEGDAVITTTHFRIDAPGGAFHSQDDEAYNRATRHGVFDPGAGIWTFRNLKPGQTTELGIQVRSNDNPGGDYEDLVIGRAEIISSRPSESDEYRYNNVVEGWKSLGSIRDKAAESDGSLKGTVSNLFPNVNDPVDFNITFANVGHTDAPLYQNFDIYNVQVMVSLSAGLQYVSHAPSSAFNVNTGIWNVGNVVEATGFSTGPDLTVKASHNGDGPLKDACLTAELIKVVPPEQTGNPVFQRNNHVKICLGDDPKLLIPGGEIDLMESYPCVSETAYPCNDQATLELATALSRTDILELNIDIGRTDGLTDYGSGQSFATILQPESMVFHLEDMHLRRKTNDNGKPFWTTENVFAFADSQILIPTADGWSNFSEGFTITAPNGGLAPGHVKIDFDSQHVTDLEFTDTTTKVEGPFKPGKDLDIILEFGSLGTYVLTMQVSVTHDTAGMLSDSGKYTFHVGPVADLEVRDAGTNPAVASDKQAYTIAAMNNGPDAVPAARVTVNGVPQGASVIASQGAYTQEACEGSRCQGVWEVGELETKDARRASGLPESATLTLLTDANHAITAVIESAQDYCVRIKTSDVHHRSDLECTGQLPTGYTEHRATYYDHVPANNTAAIMARAGTGEGHPDAIRDLRVIETPVGNILMWRRVAEVNGTGVTHYQVQQWASQWEPLANYAVATMYVDLQGRASKDYRVRAVNNQGVGGPWSITGRPPDMPGNFTVALSESGNAAVLIWTEPASPSPITAYVIDISDSAEGDSRTNDATVGANVTTWTHTGLSGGDVKFYRVQARNRDGLGPWTERQSVSTGPGAPGSLRARANGPSEIVLTWSEALSRDVTIYEYELEYSDTSASEGYEWTFLNTVLHDEGLRYVDNTVPHGTTRYYRVRARTLQGNVGGAWSNVASATTSAAGPSAPLNVSADFAVGNTENGILLTWDAPASGDASYYRIEHSTDGVTWESESARHTATCDVGGTTKFCYTDSGLFSGTEHWYRVAGVNSSGVAGEWARSNSHITQGEPTEEPGEPQNLRITSVSGRQVSLAWDAPADDGGTRVTGYEYMVEGPCVHAPEEICQVAKPTRTSGTSRTVTLPNFRGHYGFYVRALNAVGAGPYAQPVGQYINPQRNWRVELLPSRLAVKEDGEPATYRVKLTSDPGQPVWVALDWSGDPDIGNGRPADGIHSLSEQQFKWLLPSNYASQNPDIYLDPEYTAAWNTGVTITVTADEDADSENGTAQIRHDVFYIPCAELGNPAGCVDDPEDTGVTAYLTVTEEDND